MAKKSGKKSAPRKSNGKSALIFGFDAEKSWLKSSAKKEPQDKNGKSHCGRLIFLGEKSELGAVIKESVDEVHDWEITWLNSIDQHLNPVKSLSSNDGPVWMIHYPDMLKNPRAANAHDGLLAQSPYARARDLVGNVVFQSEKFKLDLLHVDLDRASPDEQLGALVGLELATYRYKNIRAKAPVKIPQLKLVGVTTSQVEEAAALASSINLARHLVNLPAGELNPKTYSEAVKKLFAGAAGMSVEIWDFEKLKKEKMGLIMAVGQAASEQPCMVHLRYRPKKGSGKAKKPIAFVGKGVTFDTGGLDLKPAAGMRLMKKDMGGSAALVGLALWAVKTDFGGNLDIYLALAENSVSADAFRPGDVVTARNGLNVEIHNTDAEGRLVMADALDVAANQKGADEPSTIIDVATLTGAIKVGLGTDLFGLFSNDDELAKKLQQASYSYGDRGWRMPLFAEYEPMLNSPVADLANASNAPFGGALTAALFLQRFVGSYAWAHLDIYGWVDAPKGALLEPGASGQAVQCLAAFLSN